MLKYNILQMFVFKKYSLHIHIVLVDSLWDDVRYTRVLTL